MLSKQCDYQQDSKVWQSPRAEQTHCFGKAIVEPKSHISFSHKAQQTVKKIVLIMMHDDGKSENKTASYTIGTLINGPL